MAMTSRGAMETIGRDGGESAGRGDSVAEHTVGRHVRAPRKVCSRLRTADGSVGRFSNFVPISYPFNTTSDEAYKSSKIQLGRVVAPRSP